MNNNNFVPKYYIPIIPYYDTNNVGKWNIYNSLQCVTLSQEHMTSLEEKIKNHSRYFGFFLF